MSRIRSIKPEFWTSEQVMECSTNARLAFVGMWNFCDDQGIHPASAKTIKAEIFPSDDITISAVEGLIGELIENGLLIRYESAGKPYWWVTGWDRHQKIDRPSKKYPAPNSMDVRRAFDECSTNTQRDLDDRSGTESSRVDIESNTSSLRSEVQRSFTKVEVVSENLKVKTVSEKPKPSARKTSFPYGESIPDELLAIIQAKLPNADAQGVFDKFRSYCLANGKTFASWEQGWRTWVMNAPKFGDHVVRGNTIEAQKSKIEQTKQLLNSSISNAMGSRISERGSGKGDVAVTNRAPLLGASTLIFDKQPEPVLGGLLFGDENDPF